MPKLPNQRSGYIGALYVYGDCTANVNTGHFTIIDTCFTSDTAPLSPRRYHLYTVDEAQSTVTELSCADSLCSSNCYAPTFQSLNTCTAMDATGTYLKHLYIPPTAPPVTVFTAPIQLESPQAVMASVSVDRDCYASVDGNAVSGWTVTHASEQVRALASRRTSID